MSISRKAFVFLLFLLATVLEATAQPYLQDLKNEDAASLDQRLKALGTTYRAEPLLGLYLVSGRNPDFVGVLLERGANPNLKAPNAAWSPLTFAVMQNLGPRIVSRLLDGGALLEPRVAGSPGNVIDAALDKNQLQVAALLVKANERRSKSSRLSVIDPYRAYVPFLADDLDQVRNILKNGDLDSKTVWNLALAGNSRKVLRYLIDFHIAPNFNATGSKYENPWGAEVVANDPDLLKYLVTNGLAQDEIPLERFYRTAFERKNLAAVQTLRAQDPVGIRPSLFRPALALGLDYLKALTHGLGDLTKPELFQPTALETVLWGDERSPGEGPLVLAILEKSDFATVAPLVKATWSDVTANRLYRYAFSKHRVDFIKAVLAVDPQRVRPELDHAALDAGLDVLKAFTRDWQDLKDPGLYGADHGREALVALLFRPSEGRDPLLGRIFDKSDWATILPVIEALSPPADLLQGQRFSAAYTAWLNRDKKEILSFALVLPPVSGVVQGDEIAVTVPFGTDLQALVARFEIQGAQVSVGNAVQVSGTTVNDFSAPVTYVVTATNGTKRAYQVTVTAEAPLEPSPVPEAAPEPAPAAPEGPPAEPAPNP